MFDSLKDGLQSAFKSLRGKGKLTESNMRDGLRLIEQSLLDADVSIDVVRQFMDHVKQEALGEKVLLALNPVEQLVGIVEQALIDVLGPVDPTLPLTKDVNIIMLCGLQGSGKTTTCGKLTQMLLESNVRPLLVAADLQRPAAIEQLHVLGDQLKVPVFSRQGAEDPVKVCREAVELARKEQHKVVILDTAGRLAIDEELMQELRNIDRRVQPDQVYLVVDGMTGQDAVNSARAFNDALELDGVIMTKLDGDARGGALLSVKQVTGVPIKFIGTGETLSALEPFRPEGMAGRILGMGDLRQLYHEAQRLVTEKEREEYERKMREGEFTLVEFRQQISKFTSQSGLFQKMIGLLPGMGDITQALQQEDTEGSVRRMCGVIDAMTPAERVNPKLIDNSRRHRIAKGAGVEASEVNQLVKQFEQMRPVMQAMAGKGVRGQMDALRQLQQGGFLDPGSQGPKMKKGTGRRLSAAEKKRNKKLRDKLRKKNKRKS